MESWFGFVTMLTFSFTGPFYLQVFGFEPTALPFTSTLGLSDNTSEGPALEKGDNVLIKSETISSTADYLGIDSPKMGLTSSNELNESLLIGTPPLTVKSIKFQIETVVELKGHSEKKEVWRIVQCDIVAYQCSRQTVAKANSTGTFFQNSTDEEKSGVVLRPEKHEDNSRVAFRPDESSCKDTLLDKKFPVITLTESTLINFSQPFELNFLQSCPPEYPHKNITELCESPWNNYSLQPTLQLFLPVMSTSNLSSTIASNVYCGLCNGFKTIDPINVTLLCGEAISDIDIHTINFSKKKCTFVISINTQQSLFRFRYRLDTGILSDDLKEKNEYPQETTSDAFIVTNTTSFGSESIKFHRINNCLPVDKTDPWVDTMGANNTMNMLGEDVHTKIDFITNNDVTGKDSNKFQCDDIQGFPFKLNVCFHSSLSLTDMKQAFVLAYGEAESDRQGKNVQHFTKMAACVSALRTHLSNFVANISSIRYHNLGSKSSPQLISLTVTYRKRTFPADLFQSVEKMNPILLPECSLAYVSNLSRCIPGFAADEELLRTESFINKFPNATSLGIPLPTPCGTSRQLMGPTESNSSRSTLECNGYVHLTIEDLTRLNSSSKLSLENYIKTMDGKFWICSEYLDNLNKLPSQSEHEHADSTDEGQGLATVICISISLAALSVTFLVKLLYCKPKKTPLKIMLNVIMSLFMSQLLILLMNVKHPVICTMVAISSHYSWLSTFSWMLVFSVHMYLTFCRSQYSCGSESLRRTLVCYGAGYGGPMVIILPTVIIHFCSCTELVVGYGVDGCFISQPLVNLVSFASPIGLSILVNVPLLLKTIYQIHKTSTSAQCLQSDAINCFRIFLKICSLSGFSWIFGYAAVLTNNNVMWYIFTILSSLQGVYIFIAFGLQDIHQACKKLTKRLDSISHELTHPTSNPLTNSYAASTL